MSIPSTSVDVPVRVRELARGAALTPVWLDGIGGLTFRTDDGRYIKWGPLDDEANMRDEAERMRWARTWISVPEVLEQGQDDAHEWLVTVAIDASSAVDPRWAAEPETAVRAVGVGLRALHDALPVAECPWEWSTHQRIADADGRPTAFVDLAALGVADRWADIAVASMSTMWNFGTGWEDTLIEAYGVDPDRDRDRLAYYRRLWNET